MTVRRRVAIVVTHPIQYYAPWYRALARLVDLDVFFAFRQTAEGQAVAGFDVAFEWDVPLLDGYRHTFLTNIAREPNVETFTGCNTPEIAGIIARESFDAVIVHGWATLTYWQAMRACWRTGTPVLVRGDSALTTPRSIWKRTAKWPLFRTFIPKFDGYLIVGQRSREYLTHYGADPRRCFDAPHAVDNQFFASRAAALRPDRAAVRRAFGLPDDAFVPVFVGRFIGRKSPADFVNAVAQAARDRRLVGLMVGDGPERAAVEALAVSTGAPIRFAGFLNQSEIPRAYVAADVLVVPSVWETWGLVVNEAMACGLPAIVTEGVGCANDLIEEGATGSVVPVGDVGRLAAAITAVAVDPVHARAMAIAAERHIAGFDVTAAAAGTLAAIEALTAMGTTHIRPLETTGVSHGSSS